MSRALVDGTESEYTYNGDNLRQTKSVDGALTTHILDGANVVADISDSGIYANFIGRTIAYMLLIAAPMYYAIICVKPHKHRLTVCAMQIVFDAIIVFSSEFADLLTGHIDKNFVLNLFPVYVIVPLVIMTVLTLIIGIVRDLVVQIN